MRKTICGRTRYDNFFFVAVLFLLFAVLSTCVSASEPSTENVGWVKQSAPNKKIGNNCIDSTARAQENYGKLPLCFIENQGQMNEKVRFYEKGNGHATFFTSRGVYLSLVGGGGRQKAEGRCRLGEAEHTQQIGLNSLNRLNDFDGFASSHPANPESRVVRLIPLGAAGNPEITAGKLQECKVNYLIGNDPEKWKTHIPTYKSVVYKGIYKNIDMMFYGNNRQLEYDIIVKPGASPSRVQFYYDGVDNLRVTGDGDLEITHKNGKLVQKKPYVYQEIEGKRVEVEGRFKIHEARSKKQEKGYAATRHPQFADSNPKSKIRNPKFIYGFQVASYDKQYPLIIDPTIAYSTYLGGSSSDGGNGIAVDSSGNAYVTGATCSSDFLLVNATDGKLQYYEAFVTKINAEGTGTVYSTYLGGSNSDGGKGIAVDSAGNAYVTGHTWSSDFPLVNEIDGSFGGDREAFVTKIDAGGTSIVYSTYLGGSAIEEGYGIAVDSAGNAYVTGRTNSSNFPLVNEIKGSFGGAGEAFVTKINAGGTSTVYSTYLGGSDNDSGTGIAVDSAGNAYVTGYTWSSDFPIVNAIYGSLGGDNDAFVTKINDGGTDIVYSTYLGGSGSDNGNGIAVDGSGNAYITGNTSSSNFPCVNAINGSSGGGSDAFVTKINDGGTSILYSTYLKGSGSDNGNGIAVDGSGNAYVTGNTSSSNFPCANATDESLGGRGDVFVTKINAEGTNIVYSTYLGGSSIDSGNGIAVDSSGNAYVTGHTWSSSFPCVNALNGSFGGVSDAFVTKIASDPPDTIASTGSITINGGASYTNSMTVTMNLSATDNTGVTGYYISGNSATPSASDSGWTSVTSTTSYSGNVSYTLNGGEGDKTIYVWYKDAEDNVSSTTSATITFDTTVPTVTISDPTLNSTYTTTNSTITLDGSADDSVSGISSVAWSNDRGENGTAIGTVSWSISSISLSIGDNTITVTVTDGAGNTGTDTITVPYAIPTMPTAVTRLAINAPSASAELKGKVIPNELPTTAWFEYGTTSGSYSNQTTRRNVGDGKMSVLIDEEISGLSLDTTYYYRVVAENSIGTAYGKEMSFTTK